jgi:hypothetical protein
MSPESQLIFEVVFGLVVLGILLWVIKKMLGGVEIRMVAAISKIEVRLDKT